MNRVTGLATVIVGCMSLCGCRQTHVDEQRIPVYPARGKVTFQGAPVAGADVAFYPSPHHGGPLSRAKTDAQGGFVLSTYTREDGAPAGNYRVTIACYADAEDVKAEDRDEAPNTLPASYAKAENSPLTTTLASGPNDLPTFDLQP